jgi:hypothetical protein
MVEQFIDCEVVRAGSNEHNRSINPGAFPSLTAGCACEIVAHEARGSFKLAIIAVPGQLP